MKRALRIGLVLVGVVVVLGLAGRWYLSGNRAAAKVSARLRALYGGPLRVETVDVGLEGTSVRGLELFEPRSAAAGEPWLSARDVYTDVSLWQTLTGTAAPTEVTLSGAAITLRLDRRGRLLTRFPRHTNRLRPGGRLPLIHLHDSRLTLRQEGRPEFVLQGIDADVSGRGDRLVLDGTVDDPTWRGWTVAGEADEATREVSFTLKSRKLVHVTPALLRRVPFVPAWVWRELWVGGDTSGEITFRSDARAGRVHYRVRLAPRRARVFVRAIQLGAAGARGNVVVEDGVVRLRGVEGVAYGGKIRADADLDFRDRVERFRFPRIDIDELMVGTLPKSWHLPEGLRGRLTGRARLEVVVTGGQVETRGEGSGEVRHARLRGRPATGLVRLKLAATPQGIRFALEEPEDEPRNTDDEARSQAGPACLCGDPA
jgi:hypothetical protein